MRLLSFLLPLSLLLSSCAHQAESVMEEEEMEDVPVSGEAPADDAGGQLAAPASTTDKGRRQTENYKEYEEYKKDSVQQREEAERAFKEELEREKNELGAPPTEPESAPRTAPPPPEKPAEASNMPATDALEWSVAEADEDVDGERARGTASGVEEGVVGGVEGGVVGGVLGGVIAGSTSGIGYGAAQQQPRTNAEPQGTETYTSYGINEMVRADQDRHSTFSIDVDTASYTISRRKLTEGGLPPTASVRVEEFVNYFDYDYVGPTGDAPFAVNMEAAPNPFQPSHHILRVGVQGRRAEEMGHKPVHLTFLVDTSGSMQSPDKIDLVKRSLRYLVEQLGPSDTVALATYAGSVRELLQPTSASEKARIDDAILELSAGGSTAMSSGIDLAYQMASTSFVYGHENRVIVLSDGDANVGATSHEQILHQIRSSAERGITLSTIGFGMGNYKDTLMEQLADQGDGNYFYVDSFEEARKVFGRDLSGTLQVIARDVKIQVEFNPEAVIAYRLVGYENRDIADRDFRNDAVDAGEIGAGHRVTALYDVVLKDDFREGDVAVVRLRNKPPGPDAPAVEWETRFPARLVHYEFAEASPSFRLAFGAASFAELLRGSPYTAEVTYGDLVRLLSVETEPVDSELIELIAAAGRLSGERIELAWE